jgi:hypothetical protein
VADFDPTLMEEIFDVPERQREANIEHHGEPDDLG